MFNRSVASPTPALRFIASRPDAARADATPNVQTHRDVRAQPSQPCLPDVHSPGSACGTSFVSLVLGCVSYLFPCRASCMESRNIDWPIISPLSIWSLNSKPRSRSSLASW